MRFLSCSLVAVSTLLLWHPLAADESENAKPSNKVASQYSRLKVKSVTIDRDREPDPAIKAAMMNFSAAIESDEPGNLYDMIQALKNRIKELEAAKDQEKARKQRTTGLATIELVPEEVTENKTGQKYYSFLNLHKFDRFEWAKLDFLHANPECLITWPPNHVLQGDAAEPKAAEPGAGKPEGIQPTPGPVPTPVTPPNGTGTGHDPPPENGDSSFGGSPFGEGEPAGAGTAPDGGDNSSALSPAGENHATAEVKPAEKGTDSAAAPPSQPAVGPQKSMEPLLIIREMANALAVVKSDQIKAAAASDDGVSNDDPNSIKVRLDNVRSVTYHQPTSEWEVAYVLMNNELSQWTRFANYSEYPWPATTPITLTDVLSDDDNQSISFRLKEQLGPQKEAYQHYKRISTEGSEILQFTLGRDGHPNRIVTLSDAESGYFPTGDLRTIDARGTGITQTQSVNYSAQTVLLNRTTPLGIVVKKAIQLGEDKEIRISSDWNKPLESGDIVSDAGGIFTVKQERATEIKISHANVTGKSIEFIGVADPKKWDLVNDDWTRAQVGRQNVYIRVEPLKTNVTKAAALKEISTEANDRKLDFFDEAQREILGKLVAANFKKFKGEIKALRISVKPDDSAEIEKAIDACKTEEQLAAFLRSQSDLLDREKEIRKQLDYSVRVRELVKKQELIKDNTESIAKLDAEIDKLTQKYEAYDLDQSTRGSQKNRAAREGLRARVLSLQNEKLILDDQNRITGYEIDASLYPAPLPSGQAMQFQQESYVGSTR